MIVQVIFSLILAQTCQLVWHVCASDDKFNISTVDRNYQKHICNRTKGYICFNFLNNLRDVAEGDVLDFFKLKLKFLLSFITFTFERTNELIYTFYRQLCTSH